MSVKRPHWRDFLNSCYWILSNWLLSRKEQRQLNKALLPFNRALAPHIEGRLLSKPTVLFVKNEKIDERTMAWLTLSAIRDISRNVEITIDLRESYHIQEDRRYKLTHELTIICIAPNGSLVRLKNKTKYSRPEDWKFYPSKGWKKEFLLDPNDLTPTRSPECQTNILKLNTSLLNLVGTDISLEEIIKELDDLFVNLWR